MMEKLNISSIPELEFEDEDTVYKFGDLYDFIKIMGYGGFGFVVGAKDKINKKMVALKIVDKTDKNNITHSKMLVYEYSIIKSLHHDNIIRVSKLLYVYN